MREIPLLLLHGYPFDHTMWYSAIAALGSRARVIAPDLPGFGKNPFYSEVAPSMEYYAEYAVKELAASGYKEAVVAGISMGGYVALALAEKYPEQCCGLALISSQTAADKAETKQGRMEMIQKIRAEGVSVVADAILPKMFSEGADPELRKYAMEGAEKAGPEGLSWALEAMAKRPDRTRLLKSLHYPVMVAHGTEDKIVPIGVARGMAAQSRNVILHEIPGAGHATPLEAPDEVANALIRLLDACRELKKESTAAESMDR